MDGDAVMITPYTGTALPYTSRAFTSIGPCPVLHVLELNISFGGQHHFLPFGECMRGTHFDLTLTAPFCTVGMLMVGIS